MSVRRSPKGAAARERETTDHLDNADAAVRKVSAERLAEGVAVVDAEARVCADCKAALVLVEPDVEERVRGHGPGRRKWGIFGSAASRLASDFIFR